MYLIMKIVFAGLLSLIMAAGCAHSPVTGKLKINLSNVSSDSYFKEVRQNQYQFSPDETSLIKIIRYKFDNQTEMQTYLLNRRMLLHQDFQNRVAPYVGLLQSDKSCVEKVNLKGEIQPVPGGEKLMMEFPITSEKVISECIKNDVWGIVSYHFYNCKAQNELFEIRYSRPLSAVPMEINPYCQ